jgi:hypothetical protein
MADDDDYGGFVFGDEQSADTDSTDDRLRNPVVAVALLLVAIVVLAAIAYPFASSAMSGLFGGSSGDAGAGNVPAGPSGTASVMAGTEPADEQAATSNPMLDTPAPTAIDEPTPTATDRSDPSTPTMTDTPTPTATGTATSAAPMIASFTATDRSGGGTARFDVGWNVTDPDSDLVAVRVTLVADPDGEARTVLQRRFDAGGAQSASGTTVEVSDGGGTTYELAIEVVDSTGNTAFELTRVVADGGPDG